MDYKGYTIDISVSPELLNQTFRATYAVRKGQSGFAGAVPGVHQTIEDAHRAAELAARHWIDQQAN